MDVTGSRAAEGDVAGGATSPAPSPPATAARVVTLPARPPVAGGRVGDGRVGGELRPGGELAELDGTGGCTVGLGWLSGSSSKANAAADTSPAVVAHPGWRRTHSNPSSGTSHAAACDRRPGRSTANAHGVRVNVYWLARSNRCLWRPAMRSTSPDS